MLASKTMAQWLDRIFGGLGVQPQIAMEPGLGAYERGRMMAEAYEKYQEYLKDKGDYGNVWLDVY